MRHGTRTRYNAGCRCDECRAAATAYQLRWRKNRTGTPPHGTLDGYVNWSCRCPECVEVHNLDNEERAARRYLARRGINLDAVLRASVTSDTEPPRKRHPSLTQNPANASVTSDTEPCG